MYDEAGHLLGEYDTNAQVLQETIYIGDTPVAIVTPEGPAIVVDNTTAGETTAVGTWPASTSIAGFLGPNYVYHTASTGTDSFTWSLSIPTTGSYHVYARWTTSSNRSTAATFTVGSNAAVHENQQNNNGVWVLLGTYSLSSGTTNIKLTTDSSGDVIADAVKAVLTTNDGSSTYYIYPDQVDAPRIVTRPVDNQMVWRWDQTDPFGAASPNQNPAGLGSFAYNPRFPGQLYDQEDNLYYNYFRNYDPTLGRYVQSDPVGLAGGIDSYQYAGSIPLTAIDSSGGQMFFVLPPPGANDFGAFLLTAPKKVPGMYACNANCPTIPTVCPAPDCPTVSGYGIGSNANDAIKAAKKDASDKSPPGCQAKHCTYKCIDPKGTIFYPARS